MDIISIKQLTNLKSPKSIEFTPVWASSAIRNVTWLCLRRRGCRPPAAPPRTYSRINNQLTALHEIRSFFFWEGDLMLLIFFLFFIHLLFFSSSSFFLVFVSLSSVICDVIWGRFRLKPICKYFVSRCLSWKKKMIMHLSPFPLFLSAFRHFPILLLPRLNILFA